MSSFEAIGYWIAELEHDINQKNSVLRDRACERLEQREIESLLEIVKAAIEYVMAHDGPNVATKEATLERLRIIVRGEVQREHWALRTLQAKANAFSQDAIEWRGRGSDGHCEECAGLTGHRPGCSQYGQHWVTY